MRIFKSIFGKIAQRLGKKAPPTPPPSSPKKSHRSAETPAPSAPPLIASQLHLAPSLPTVVGNVDYCNFRDQLFYIDDLLVASGLEQECLESSLREWLAANAQPNPKAQLKFQAYTRLALRCNIARTLLQEDFRGFAVRLADSPLLQRFCKIDELGYVQVPSKSTLQRFAARWPEATVRAWVERLLRTGKEQPAQLGLEEPLDLEALFLDTTCVPANIHYPVDWVLFRDATRTLMKAVRLIRDQGLKHRMEEPEEFLRRMNRLSMEMTQQRDKARRQRHRRKVLRKMDRLLGTVRNHAQRYRQLLDQQWQQTDWTRKQAEQVLRRIAQVLELLPKARQQARQRILEGKAVKNQDKVLSLYEAEVRVLVRHKAGA